MKLILLSILAIGCAGHKHHTHHHRFDDATKWAKIFEDTKRDIWQQPEEVIKFAQVEKDSIVADIGSATGYFPVRLAKKAIKGRVWGIDVEPNLVNYLNKRAREGKISNLYSILGTFDDPLIPEPADRIFVVNTYHHIGKRKAYFSKLKQSYLRDKGTVVIVDFKKGKLPFGPKDHVKLSADQVISEMELAGFKLVQKLTTLPYQYGLIFR